jgi:alpha-1,3-rhamnosyl/mannosyltransferase
MPKRWARLYYSLLMRYSLKRAKRVFVPSRATARDLLRFYRVPARKLSITTEAADDSFRPINDQELLKKVRAAYGLPHRFILAVGARRPHKNFVRLVEAVARLREVEGAMLVLVGEADERFNDAAAEAAKRLDLPVRFLGKVPERDLPVLYNLATVFACPSLIEGFGLPVLEAMACGTPVVCSAIPVFRETAGDAAMQIAPDSTSDWATALERILSQPSLRTHLSDAGRRRAAQFSWGRSADAVLSAYSELGILPRNTS